MGLCRRGVRPHVTIPTCSTCAAAACRRHRTDARLQPRRASCGCRRVRRCARPERYSASSAIRWARASPRARQRCEPRGLASVVLVDPPVSGPGRRAYPAQAAVVRRFDGARARRHGCRSDARVLSDMDGRANCSCAPNGCTPATSARCWRVIRRLSYRRYPRRLPHVSRAVATDHGTSAATSCATRKSPRCNALTPAHASIVACAECRPHDSLGQRSRAFTPRSAISSARRSPIDR